MKVNAPLQFGDLISSILSVIIETSADSFLAPHVRFDGCRQSPAEARAAKPSQSSKSEQAHGPCVPWHST